MSDWRAKGRCVPHFGNWDHFDTTTKVGICGNCTVRLPCAQLGLDHLAEYGTTNRDAGMEVYGGHPLHQLARALAGVLTRLSPDRHRHAYRTVGYGGAGWHLLRCDCGAEDIG